jgi:polyisoprenyl-teichoic acid--peptidoglycan teichoic acid transferase
LANKKPFKRPPQGAASDATEETASGRSGSSGQKSSPRSGRRRSAFRRFRTIYQVEGPPKARRWKRIVLWSAVGLVLVVLLLGTGSYLWFRAQVSSANQRVTPEIRQALQEKPSTTLTTQPSTEMTVAGATTTTVKEPSPSAMNLLVIGSDRRSNDASLGARSDTLMIVHVDPDENYLSVLSLPRDLRVTIPGYGKGKLNTAFAMGGPALAIKTIEQTTGVDIGHYLEIGFDAFAAVVDSLGGVYLDVDKRYLNTDYNYELINLYPGYQLLNGANSLDYVRFRHDNNMDFGRMERQQRFLSALREQAMGWDLPFKLPSLISALFSDVTTDVDANEILRLAKWGVGLNGDSIRTITLTGDTPTIGGASYVVVTEDQLARAVDELLYMSTPEATSGVVGTGLPGSPRVSSQIGARATGGSGGATGSGTTSTTQKVDPKGLTVDISGASGRTGEAGAAADWLRSLGVTVAASADAAGDAQDQSSIEYPAGMQADAKRVASATGIQRLTRTGGVSRVTLLLGQDFVLPAAFALSPSPDNVPDAALWKQWAAQTPFSVEAPAYLPSGYVFVSRYPGESATYGIKVGGGAEPAFRTMYAAKSNADQLLGITETTWLGAPAASKGLEVTHNGTVYTVVRNGAQVERVWWKAGGVLYFVSNTLSDWVDQDELLRVAESMIAIPN